MNFIDYLIIINIIGFIICFLDKRYAICGKRRVPEKVLLSISLIGGCFGFIIGMHIFRHKTRKVKFKLVYLFCGVWIWIIIKVFNI